MRPLPVPRRLPCELLPLVFAVLLSNCHAPHTTVANQLRNPPMISEMDALRIAKEAIEGKVNTQEGAPVTVEMEDDCYIITFVHINPPDTLGPDYDAMVTIDATSGEVLEILGGT